MKVQAGADVAVELKFPDTVVDGLRAVPEGVNVVNAPPLSTETSGRFEDADTLDARAEGSPVKRLGNARRSVLAI